MMNLPILCGKGSMDEQIVTFDYYKEENVRLLCVLSLPHLYRFMGLKIYRFAAHEVSHTTQLRKELRPRVGTSPSEIFFEAIVFLIPS